MGGSSIISIVTDYGLFTSGQVIFFSEKTKNIHYSPNQQQTAFYLIMKFLTSRGGDEGNKIVNILRAPKFPRIISGIESIPSLRSCLFVLFR
jgi:hypothetical protein